MGELSLLSSFFAFLIGYKRFQYRGYQRIVYFESYIKIQMFIFGGSIWKQQITK